MGVAWNSRSVDYGIVRYFGLSLIHIFLSYRGFRLNYYAVNALLARVYAYKLDKKQAYDYAKICLLYTSRCV